jgi:hypothetical protein
VVQGLLSGGLVLPRGGWWWSSNGLGWLGGDLVIAGWWFEDGLEVVQGWLDGGLGMAWRWSKGGSVLRQKECKPKE